MAKALDSSVSLVKTRQTDEKERKIAFVGHVSHQIVGAKLPSNRQVLEVFFYNLRFVKLSTEESANLTIESVLIFWQQARIPARRKDKCVGKILQMYEDWRTYNKKKVHELSSGIKKKLDDFIDTLDDLFDVATADALTTIRKEEDREFLKKQRQKGRPGSMVGVDMVLAGREERSKVRKEQEEARKIRHEQSTILQQSAGE